MNLRELNSFKDVVNKKVLIAAGRMREGELLKILGDGAMSSRPYHRSGPVLRKRARRR